MHVNSSQFCIDKVGPQMNDLFYYLPPSRAHTNMKLEYEADPGLKLRFSNRRCKNFKYVKTSIANDHLQDCYFLFIKINLNKITASLYSLIELLENFNSSHNSRKSLFCRSSMASKWSNQNFLSEFCLYSSLLLFLICYCLWSS